MVKLFWKAIKRDVDRVTHSTAKVRMSDASPEVVDVAQTDDSQTSVRMVMRWAEEGIADMLSFANGSWKRRSEAPMPVTENDDWLHHDLTEWSFEKGGDSVVTNETDDRTMAILMHQFVVGYILWQWAVTSMPGVVGEMQTRYQTAKNNLKEEMYEQAMPVKKRPYKMESWDVEVETEWQAAV